MAGSSACSGSSSSRPIFNPRPRLWACPRLLPAGRPTDLRPGAGRPRTCLFVYQPTTLTRHAGGAAGGRKWCGRMGGQSGRLLGGGVASQLQVGGVADQLSTRNNLHTTPLQHTGRTTLNKTFATALAVI